jgi:hypothetical protein
MFVENAYTTLSLLLSQLANLHPYEPATFLSLLWHFSNVYGVRETTAGVLG